MRVREKLQQIVNVDSKDTIRNQISQYLLDSININIYPNIQELSKKCFIAKSTIVRYCKQLGFEGYKELINKIKFEDQNNYSSFVEKTNLTSDLPFEYKIYKDSIISFLDDFDIQLETLEKIADLIFTSKKIYLHFSYEIENIANIFHNFLLLINKNVVYTNTRKMMSRYLDFLDEECLQIFVIVGVDNEYLKTMYSYSIKNDCSKKVLIASESQAMKFKDSDVKLVLDFHDDYTKVHDKEIKLLYVFKQLLIILEKKCDINLRNPKHKF